ncbi:hypothetical protein CI610_02933 [invertebrate metagenome]|uniref:SWIM-type domain-containing protein n=1 Tax=invertebrate metagenome TaxID=1711999 RepID=A0A2H9T4J0_9ZZZZ
MSIVFPNGYVLDTVGPFLGSDNDAKITDKILTSLQSLSGILEEDDQVIVDRGFRDILSKLSDEGYETHMPTFLKPGQSQHDGIEANTDRCITKTRWVVESYHSRFKQFRFFKTELTSNYFIKNLESLLKSVTACLNWLRGPIYQPSSTKAAEDEKVALEMKSLLNKSNILAERVEKEPDLSRRAKSQWQKLEAAQLEFPRLDQEYLETLACGTYQVKLAPGYISEHLTADGDYEVMAYQHSSDLIRCQIRSRHQSQTKYNIWIQYSVTEQPPIQNYYCTCPTGQRTVGMCAHIASVLFYLGVYVHSQSRKPLRPTKFMPLMK